ncbi:MAG: hypothetical protein LIP01_02130 [Tannerellaceae bacterium]|nr:hypothetical protein [Tannerellaceae bacterium]
MIDVKFVNNRIYFDLAAAIKEAEGQLKIEDALVIAATPCVLVDYASTPDSELKYISRAMRRFFKRNPRYTKFTKAAVMEGLRQEWLPNLEEEDKKGPLTDLPITPAVDVEGYVIYSPTWVENLNAKPNPDQNQYGKQEFTRVNLSGTERKFRPGSATAKKYCSRQDEEGFWGVDLDITADEWYEIIKDASPLVHEYLKCYIQVPDGYASTAQVEKMFDIPAGCINARNTALGKRAQRMLDIEVYDPDGNRRFWSTPMLKGRTEGGLFRWVMRPELVEAAKRLAKEENWELPRRVDLE